jgi:streptogramin lyase
LLPVKVDRCFAGRTAGQRIDPKTNKVSKTIELLVPNSDGDIAVGEGSVWVTLKGFPISRIDPKTDKVAQQFVRKAAEPSGPRRRCGYPACRTGSSGSCARPRRIVVTLAE